MNPVISSCEQCMELFDYWGHCPMGVFDINFDFEDNRRCLLKGIHKDCPLRKAPVTVRLKTVIMPTLMSRFGKTRQTIYNWIESKGFPKPRKVYGSLTWVEADIDEWAAGPGKRWAR